VNPTIKELWINALEADDAPEQGQRYLGLPTGERCCLGVLCDIAVKEGVIPEPITVDGSGEYALRYGVRTPNDNDTSIHALPFAVRDWAGLNEINPQVLRDDVNVDGYQIESLAEYNDGGYNFKQIANVIREEL
jgi:hypothetical protein